MEEFIIKYKTSPLVMRLAITILVGVAYPVFYYWEKGEELEGEKQYELNEVSRENSAFKKARKKNEEIPELEQQLAFAEEQLKQSEKLLPSKLQIGDILQRTSLIAKDTGITLNEFVPLGEVPGDGGNYKKAPITLKVMGRYSQIASFMDLVVHQGILVQFENFKLYPDESELKKVKGASNRSRELTAKEQRSLLRVRGEMSMVVFKGTGSSLSAGTEAQVLKNMAVDLNSNDKKKI